jgi:MFS family permease
MTKTKIAILSISLLSILMIAGISSILSVLVEAIPDATTTSLKVAISISAITCVAFSLLTGYLDQFFTKKTLLFTGLILYAVGGVGGGLINSMTGLMVTRAVLGIGAGICLPLATAFIADFYEGEERKITIGYSIFAANLAIMLLPLIGAWLAAFNWRFGFSIYGISLVVLVLAWLYIPDRPVNRAMGGTKRKLFYFSKPVVIAAILYFICMVLFMSLASNLSVLIKEEALGTPSTAAWVNAIATLVSMLLSLNFARIYHLTEKWMLTLGLLTLSLGFAVMGLFSSLWPVILGHSLISGALGLLHPLFPFMATQSTPREHSTSAMSLVTAGFRLGTFASPFFFLLLDPLFGVNSIRSEFSLSAVIFGLVAAITVIISMKQQVMKPA